MSLAISTPSPVALATVNAPLASQLSLLLAQAVECFDEDTSTARGYIARAADLLNGKVVPDGPETRGKLATWQEHRVRRYIEQHLEETIAIDDIAAMVRLSASHFSRAFRSSFGTSPYTYVIERRIEKSKQLMRAGADALSQIALDCGFADQAHFSRQFKRVTGETPNAWRRTWRIDPTASDMATALISA